MVEWLSVNQLSGSGITIISVTASANTLSTSRTTSIVVSGLTTSVVVPITQEYIQTTLSVNPNTFTFQSSGGTSTFEVYSPYDWYSSGVTSDCSISPVSGSSGTTTVTLSVSANTAYEKQFSFDIYNEHQSETVHVSQDAASSSGSVTDYLTFEIISGGHIHWIKGRRFNANAGTIQYSINNGPWSSVTPTTSGTGYMCSVSAGDVVRFKGDNSCYSQYPGYDYSYAACFCGTTATFNVRGNINSLIDSTGFSAMTTLSSAYTFQFLFHYCNVISAYDLVLPNTSLTECCYDHLFSNCTGLTLPPRLTAETLGIYCYNSMFYNCGALESTQPSLPATALTEGCYYSMFRGCTGLRESPLLPADTLVDYSYYGMFSGCTQLSAITALATSVTASNCTNNWVRNVSSAGTFTKATTMSGWSTGNNGIPSGWTVVDAT